MAKKTVTEKTLKTTTKKTESTMATVYIGCSLPGLKKNTVFTGGRLPEYVKQMIAEDENIGKLIVSVSELPIARQNVVKKGHWLNICAEKLKAKKLKKED